MDASSQQPRSRRWQYAIIGAAIGGLVVVALALAFRGPAVIHINSCGCCMTDPCRSGGYVPRAPLTGDRQTGQIVPFWPIPYGPGASPHGARELPGPGSLALVAAGALALGLARMGV